MIIICLLIIFLCVCIMPWWFLPLCIVAGFINAMIPGRRR